MLFLRRRRRQQSTGMERTAIPGHCNVCSWNRPQKAERDSKEWLHHLMHHLLAHLLALSFAHYQSVCLSFSLLLSIAQQPSKAHCADTLNLDCFLFFHFFFPFCIRVYCTWPSPATYCCRLDSESSVAASLAAQLSPESVCSFVFADCSAGTITGDRHWINTTATVTSTSSSNSIVDCTSATGRGGRRHFFDDDDHCRLLFISGRAVDRKTHTWWLMIWQSIGRSGARLTLAHLIAVSSTTSTYYFRKSTSLYCTAPWLWQTNWPDFLAT